MLRPHQAEDFADCASMWADPAVTRDIGGKPFSAEETWTKLLRYAGLWSLLGYGYWVAREKTSGRFVGELGFADFKRDVTPVFNDVPEVGWALASWAWGKGLATEGVRGALAWLDARGTHPRTVCMIGPRNRQSIRVAEKCGFDPWQEATYKGAGVTLFERDSRKLVP